jgi:glycopeptide antibiotics resistance protein
LAAKIPRETRKATVKAICLAVFVIYILVVLNLTLFRVGVYYDKRQLNLSLFVDLIYIYKYVGKWQFIRLFLGNIGWFVPFGMLLPVLLKRGNAFKVVALGFLFSLSIEILQFIFRKGIAELDDLILNTLGAMIGYLLYKLLLKKRLG